MDPTTLATWEGHGRPQWFYMYSAAENPGVRQEDGPDVGKARLTPTGLRFKTREGPTFGWPPDVPFWAIVHCCAGEELYGDPHGLHTMDCPEYLANAERYEAKNPPPPPPPVRSPRHCGSCTCAAS